LITARGLLLHILCSAYHTFLSISIYQKHQYAKTIIRKKCKENKKGSKDRLEEKVNLELG
jgi:hypothetical protein